MSADFSVSKIGAARNQFAKRGRVPFPIRQTHREWQLLRGVEQRLMIVRAVNIHEPFANGGEHIERGRRAVDELAVGARRW